MYIIGDVHGCYDTLVALLSKLPNWREKRLCFVGDLIDRGPKSKQVVDLVIQLQKEGVADCVKGNHEHMMVDYSLGKAVGMWLGNGGQQCRDSYFEKPDALDPRTDPENDEYVPGACLKGLFNEEKFNKHCDWMDLLPTYLEYPDLKLPDGRHLVVSHSHACTVWDEIKNSNNKEINWDAVHNALLWGRPRKFKRRHQEHNIYNVIGHTPREKARVRSFYTNVDSGCFWKKELKQNKYGHLSALEFPEMKVYIHKCIDEVNW